MIPLQITLQGFLSYRDATTLSFEGASLWMLAGANGAGKSSVFDAMRWTLFGAHRGGKSGHEALIHRDLDRLRVAFDLALGEQRFRLIRTLARAGRSTWQIEEILGDETIKIPETDGREGYEKWVRERIGLSDETFTTAMYLAQNRGDAMLSASAAQRYEMLAEIVDISAYAALHERAKIAATQGESATRIAKTNWELAPDADPNDIQNLQVKLRELGEQIARNSARRETILGLEPLAAQWQTWQNERATTRQNLDDARLLLAGAPQIERDVARRGELETLLPPLSRYVGARGRAAQTKRDLAALEAESGAARAQLAASETRLDDLQFAFDALENARAAAETARVAALAQQNEIAPRLSLARQIASYRAEIAGLEGELAAFSPDLMGRRSGLEARITRAGDDLAVGATLRRLAREKIVYRSAREHENAAQTLIGQWQSALLAARLGAESGREQLEIARQNATRALERASAAATREADSRAALSRFESVENEVDCFFCGQKLTPAHRQSERARLEIALQTAAAETETARKALEAADLAAREAQAGFEAARNAAQSAENALQDANREQQSAANAGEIALQTAHSTFDELPATWRADAAVFAMAEPAPASTLARSGVVVRPETLGMEASPAPSNGLDSESVAGFKGSDVDANPAAILKVENRAFFAALEGDFPDVASLPSAEGLTASIGAWRVELEGIATSQAQQLRAELRLGDRKNQLAPLVESAPPETLEILEERDLAAQNALDGASQVLKNGGKALQTARAAAETARNAVGEGRELSAALEGQRVGLAATQVERQRAVSDEESGAQSALLASFSERDENELSTILGELERENAALSDSDLDARREQLHLAQERVSQLETEAAGLDKSLQGVPFEARRAPAEFRAEVEALKIALQNDAALQAEAELEKNRLEAWRDAKIRLARQHFELEQQARQARTLADLLGPHQLQRFLLREAENGIVDEANAVLDRISSGSLRLELRADDEEIAGARKGVPKVLDLAIRAVAGGNSAAGGNGAAAMLPVFLSGSQRFRVSVALALGIGRYATRGGGSRLEAVIIDEGFGALDRIGRGEMIDELQMLGEELQRVILVSHQEEFFEAFPNRYLIENDGFTSTARLMAE